MTILINYPTSWLKIVFKLTAFQAADSLEYRKGKINTTQKERAQMEILIRRVQTNLTKFVLIWKILVKMVAPLFKPKTFWKCQKFRKDIEKTLLRTMRQIARPRLIILSILKMLILTKLNQLLNLRLRIEKIMRNWSSLILTNRLSWQP